MKIKELVVNAYDALFDTQAGFGMSLDEMNKRIRRYYSYDSLMTSIVAPLLALVAVASLLASLLSFLGRHRLDSHFEISWWWTLAAGVGSLAAARLIFSKDNRLHAAVNWEQNKAYSDGLNALYDICNEETPAIEGAGQLASYLEMEARKLVEIIQGNTEPHYQDDPVQEERNRLRSVVELCSILGLLGSGEGSDREALYQARAHRIYLRLFGQTMPA